MRPNKNSQQWYIHITHTMKPTADTYSHRHCGAPVLTCWRKGVGQMKRRPPPDPALHRRSCLPVCHQLPCELPQAGLAGAREQPRWGSASHTGICTAGRGVLCKGAGSSLRHGRVSDIVFVLHEIGAHRLGCCSKPGAHHETDKCVLNTAVCVSVLMTQGQLAFGF